MNKLNFVVIPNEGSEAVSDSPLIEALKKLRLSKQDLRALLFPRVENNGTSGLSPTVPNEYGRLFSWEYCYSYFYLHQGEFLDPKTDPSDDDLDRGALELYAYLASFGMFRSNAALKELNRKIFVPVLDALFRQARQLEINPYELNGLLSKPQVESLMRAVRQGYRSALSEAQYMSRNPTATLESKILMGVMGVLPAFDRYFATAANDFNAALANNGTEFRMPHRLSFKSLNFPGLV